MSTSSAPKEKRNRAPGFTLIELLITMGIFSILATLISINLINPQKTTSVDSQIQTILSDIKSQQLKSMQGETGGAAISQKHGIYVSANKYTLFTGNTYIPADPSNFEVVLEGDLQLSTTFSSSVLLFENRSGEVSNFSPTQNTITITSPSGGLSKVITVNTYGSLLAN